MLAGVGPVRLVLFVVAADEGWKPQSEEHLQILDVLGVAGGVVALTKRDLVDDETLEIAEQEVRERLAGTGIAEAPIVPVSAHTGEGIDALGAALEAMLAAAPPPERARTRLFVDRVFTIRGAGTVVTGTLTGDCLAIGDEVALEPTEERGRIRSLQTHKRQEERACPVTRVAANLVGADRSALERGDVLAVPGAWRPTRVFDATLRDVRGLAKPIGERGAFKVYAGAAEADASVRLADTPGGMRVARLRLSRPLVLDVGDRFVVRDAGRRATVGGGVVLDTAPPHAFVREEHLAMLDRRASAARDELPRLLIDERRAVPAAEVSLLTGATAPVERTLGAWCVAQDVRASAVDAIREVLSAHHAAEPLAEGLDLAAVREAVVRAVRASGGPPDPGLVDALLDAAAAEGTIVRTATTVRLAEHRVRLEERSDDVARLLAALSGERLAQPPTVKELLADGFPADVLEAAGRAGHVVRIAPELVVAPELVDRALAVVRTHAGTGLTVSGLREALGTSRKYAVPLAEWMDREGLTRREGDLRFPR